MPNRFATRRRLPWRSIALAAGTFCMIGGGLVAVSTPDFAWLFAVGLFLFLLSGSQF